MKITVKLLSMAGSSPSGFDEFGVRAIDMVAVENFQSQLIDGLEVPL